MSSDAGTPALPEEQAREIINRWAAAGFLRLRNLGDKIFIDAITAGAAYTVRLQTNYEQRRVQQVSEPFHGGPVDDRGRPPEPWAIRVAAPGPFQERTQAVPIPHTERVQMCPSCSGQGRVTCRGCGGQGRMPCPLCGGRGFREEQQVEPGAPGGAPSVRVIRRPCGCGGGLVVCPGCAGGGLVRCDGCAGSGQVKTFDRLVVRFHNAKQGEVLDVTPVPDDWLGRLAGDVLVDVQAPRIDDCPPEVPETVAAKARELLARSHAINADQERILVQLLHIERLPLHEVRYRYAGVERQLWICGTEQALHAPKAPWNRTRLYQLLGGIGAAIVALIVVIALLLR
ncbi:MAG: hypothetical protein U0736_14475 [Gemmataceae bacterium]